MLLEEFILGDEHSFDCVSVRGKPVWHSISEYTPGPLAVMQNEWIQWTVLLPRDISGREYDPIRKAGATWDKGATGFGVRLIDRYVRDKLEG